MSKTIDTLLTKVEQTGTSNLNGRIVDRWGEGELQEKYHMELHNGLLRVRHWGTTILVLDTYTGTLKGVLITSNSDRDTVNQVFNHYNVQMFATHRPIADNGGGVYWDTNPKKNVYSEFSD